MSLAKEVGRLAMIIRDGLENDSHVGHLVRELEAKEPLSPQEQRINSGDALLVVDNLTGKTILFGEKAEKPVYGTPGQEDW